MSKSKQGTTCKMLFSSEWLPCLASCGIKSHSSGIQNPSDSTSTSTSTRASLAAILQWLENIGPPHHKPTSFFFSEARIRYDHHAEGVHLTDFEETLSLVKMPVLERLYIEWITILHSSCYLQGKLPSRICTSTSPYYINSPVLVPSSHVTQMTFASVPSNIHSQPSNDS